MENLNTEAVEEQFYTIDDMANILKTSIGALKASYHLAVKKIEKILKED